MYLSSWCGRSSNSRFGMSWHLYTWQMNTRKQMILIIVRAIETDFNVIWRVNYCTLGIFMIADHIRSRPSHSTFLYSNRAIQLSLFILSHMFTCLSGVNGSAWCILNNLQLCQYTSQSSRQIKSIHRVPFTLLPVPFVEITLLALLLCSWGSPTAFMYNESSILNVNVNYSGKYLDHLGYLPTNCPLYLR